jgi:hypothetical protein
VGFLILILFEYCVYTVGFDYAQPAPDHLLLRLIPDTLNFILDPSYFILPK